MELSIFLAKAFSLYLIIVGLGMLLNAKTYQNILKDFSMSSSSYLIGGIIALILGILLVLTHNTWHADWTVIITVLAWLTLIKGVLYMLAPQVIMKTVAPMQKTSILYTCVIGCLALGLVLFYYGFLAN